MKCPFKYKTDRIKQALDAQDKDFCLELAANGLHLKRTHPYYSQVQTQIFVTSAKHCDLVVWTQRDMAVVCIFPDVDFWERSLRTEESRLFFFFPFLFFFFKLGWSTACFKQAGTTPELRLLLKILKMSELTT